MTDFTIIRPVDITDVRLTSSTVPEPAVGDTPDPAAWSAVTAYNAGNRVSRLAIHKIFEKLVTGAASATPPESDTTNWVEVSSTNRWRMFDEAIESQSSLAEEIEVVITPGVLADAVALFAIEGTTARVRVDGTAYDETIELTSRVVENWYDYFFEPFESRVDVAFVGLPLRLANVVRITVSNPGGVTRIGKCVLGLSKVIGQTEYGLEAGIISYSSWKTNVFGFTTVTRRTPAKRISVPVEVPNERVDFVRRLLASYEGEPVVWLGAGQLFEAFIVYGYYRDFAIVVPYPTFSKCSIRIEGNPG